jgi:tetratricopeptide (TPR) repeat protein
MIKLFGFFLATLRASAIVLVSVFVITHLDTAPATGIGWPSPSLPEQNCITGYYILGYVWSENQKECVEKTSEILTDDDFFLQARAYIKHGKYIIALDLLRRIENQNQPRVLNYFGYSTRKLGDVDGGIAYYKKALALDPNYNEAREYLGEGYLQKGDLASAKQQLAEIEKRCGTGCEAYEDLAEEITKFEAKN